MAAQMTDEEFEEQVGSYEIGERGRLQRVSDSANFSNISRVVRTIDAEETSLRYANDTQYLRFSQLYGELDAYAETKCNALFTLLAAIRIQVENLDVNKMLLAIDEMVIWLVDAHYEGHKEISVAVYNGLIDWANRMRGFLLLHGDYACAIVREYSKQLLCDSPR